MKRMTVSQKVNEMYRVAREREMKRVFNVMTREEVLGLLEKYADLGILTVRETKTKVVITMKKHIGSYHFEDVVKELNRTCKRRDNSYNCFGHLEISKFKIENATIQINF